MSNNERKVDNISSLLNAANRSDLSVSCDSYCPQLTGFDTHTTIDPISTIDNRRSIRNDSIKDFENIVIRKCAIATPIDISILHKEPAVEKQSRRNQKRKCSIFNETVMGKKSVAELNSMVAQNNKHMEFLSQCGQLSKSRKCVILEDNQNLMNIIQQKQSASFSSDVFEKNSILTDTYESVSSNIYNYYSLSIVGQ